MNNQQDPKGEGPAALLGSWPWVGVLLAPGASSFHFWVHCLSWPVSRYVQRPAPEALSEGLLSALSLTEERRKFGGEDASPVPCLEFLPTIRPEATFPGTAPEIVPLSSPPGSLPNNSLRSPPECQPKLRPTSPLAMWTRMNLGKV